MNTFTIEQSEKQTQSAVVVHRNSEINGIRLARTKASSDRPEDSLKKPIVFSMDVKAKHIEHTDGLLLIEVSFRLSGSEKNDQSKNKALVCVECTFVAGYQLRPDYAPTVDQIKAFKDGNAIFNCWPYCRQHVQDMLLRMGYPPLTLPFLRVQTKKSDGRKHTKAE